MSRILMESLRKSGPVAVLILGALLLCAARGHAAELPLAGIRLPPGFRIDLYADKVPGARSMALSPGGILFVGTRDVGKVYAVLDRGRKNRADEVIPIASGMNMPNGVAFRDGALYVAEVSRVLRYDGIPRGPSSSTTPSPAIRTMDGNSSGSGRTAIFTCPSVRRATSARKRTRAMPGSCA
jgi:glucose/arabinose dehydrogenase